MKKIDKFVSKELAELLEEQGLEWFDQDDKWYYYDNGGNLLELVEGELSDGEYQAPTIDDVLCWLREEADKVITVNKDEKGWFTNYTGDKHYMEYKEATERAISNAIVELREEKFFETYRQTLEDELVEGLDYVYWDDDKTPRYMKDMKVGDKLWYAYRNRIDGEYNGYTESEAHYEYIVGEFKISNIDIETKKQVDVSDKYDFEPCYKWVDCFQKHYTLVPSDEGGEKIMTKLMEEKKNDHWGGNRNVHDGYLTMELRGDLDREYTQGWGTGFNFYTKKEYAYETLYSPIEDSEKIIKKSIKLLEDNKDVFKQLPEYDKFLEWLRKEDRYELKK